MKKKLKGKSRCADYMAIRSFFDKMRDKYEIQIIASQFLID